MSRLAGLEHKALQVRLRTFAQIELRHSLAAQLKEPQPQTVLTVLGYLLDQAVALQNLKQAVNGALVQSCLFRDFSRPKFRALARQQVQDAQCALKHLYLVRRINNLHNGSHPPFASPTL